jgi:hypothetical protein
MPSSQRLCPIQQMVAATLTGVHPHVGIDAGMVAYCYRSRFLLDSTIGSGNLVASGGYA